MISQGVTPVANGIINVPQRIPITCTSYTYTGSGSNYWAVDGMKALFDSIDDGNAFICDLLITGNNSNANGRYTAMGFRKDANNGNIEIIGHSVSGNVQKIVGIVNGTLYE